MNISSYLPKGKDKTFLFNEEISFSYNQVNQISKNFELDMSRKLCLFFFDTSIDALITYVTVLSKNCAVLVLDPKLNNNLIENYIEKFSPEFIAGSNIAHYSGKVLFSHGEFRLKEINSNIAPIGNMLSVLLPTSGSTGNSKVVRITSKNLAFSAEKISKYLDIKSNDILTTSLPLHYSYGLSILNIAIYQNASIFVKEYSFLSKSYWNLLKESKITHFAGVPTMFKNIIDAKAMKLLPDSLKSVTVAGGKLAEPLSMQLINLSLKKNFNFFSMYGATEATPRMSYVPPKYSREKIGSAGIPIEGGEFSIENFNNSSEGEIIYSGKNVALGYAKNREHLTNSDEFKGILKTGDIGYIDKDGFLFVTGRLKRIGKARGIRINLDDIENSLTKNNYNVMVVEISDNIVIASLENNKKEIIDFLKSKEIIDLGTVKFIQVRNFPLNSNLKKNYIELTNNLTKYIVER